MPRPRKEDARATRELALRAAHGLLLSYGYQGVSMDAVAGAVQVRKASLYHHFPGGKEELVLTIVERAIVEQGAGIVQAAAQGETARDRLTAIAAYVLAGPAQTARLLRDALRFLSPAQQQRVAAAFYQQHHQPVMAVFTQGVESGQLRSHDTGRSTWAYLGLLSELSEQWAAQEPGASPAAPDLAPWIVSLMIDGLRA